MKTMAVFVLALLLGAPLQAQETLIDGDVDFGGYGGVMGQLTSINKKLGALMGGGGGVIVDHAFVLGGAGYGLVNNVSVPGAPNAMPYLNFSYGGVIIRYIHAADRLVHLSGGVLVGGGGAGFRSDLEDNLYNESSRRDTLNDAFFVFEPDIEAELNVVKYFRISVGAGYRFVSGIELPGLGNSDLSGPEARLMLKFGSF